jgi:hypothetical protein
MLFVSLGLILSRAVTCMVVTTEGFGLIIGFNEHLQLVNIGKDYSVTVLHTSHTTIGHTRSFILLQS